MNNYVKRSSIINNKSASDSERRWLINFRAYISMNCTFYFAKLVSWILINARIREYFDRSLIETHQSLSIGRLPLNAKQDFRRDDFFLRRSEQFRLERRRISCYFNAHTNEPFKIIFRYSVASLSLRWNACVTDADRRGIQRARRARGCK